MEKIAAGAMEDSIRGYGNFRVTIDPDALAHLVKIADGDARSLLNALELAVQTTPAKFPPPPGEAIHITLAIAEESIQKKALLYDRDGDAHFDTISAFIKSMRGSDPDAVFYWLARMVASGEDPRFIFRRMLIFACEDVGMADPQALIFVQAAANAFDRIGLPEGRFHLANAALYLATAAKSNSVMGFFDAIAFAESEKLDDVPRHLRDASRDKEGFGHGEGYLYPHAYADHWVAQQYLPAGLTGKLFYQPGGMGYEKEIAENVMKRREEQLETGAAGIGPEILSFSPGEKGRELWLMRASGSVSKQAAEIRERIYSMLSVARHHRVLDCNAGRGLLLWEALRRCPEGAVAGLVPDKDDSEIISHHASGLEDLMRPFLVPATLEQITPQLLAENNAPAAFDIVVGRNVFGSIKDINLAARILAELLAPDGSFAFAEMLPGESEMLSAAVMPLWKEGGEILLSAETRMRGNDKILPRDFLTSLFGERGLAVRESPAAFFENRIAVTGRLMEAWLAESEKTSYGNALAKVLSADMIPDFKQKLGRLLAGREIILRTAVLFLAGKKQRA